MIAFASMLLEASNQAGIKTPPDDDKRLDEELDSLKDEYPHFFLFCCAQLARPMSPGAHWENAKVIAKIPDEDVRKVTFEGLIERGWII